MAGKPITDPLTTGPPEPLVDRSAWVQLNAMNTIVIPHDPKRSGSNWFASDSDPSTQPAPKPREKNEVRYFIDGPDTFRAFAAAMDRAKGEKDFIYLVGWWCDVDLKFTPSRTLGDILAAKSRDKVEIRMMLTREFWQEVSRRSGYEMNNKACEFVTKLETGFAIHDGRCRTLGTHHQKMLIVKGGDEIIGFCGGVDINADRVQALGNGSPQHDVHCEIRGPAAYDLLRTFCERWTDYIDHRPLPAPGKGTGLGFLGVEHFRTLRGHAVLKTETWVVTSPQEDEEDKTKPTVLIARTYPNGVGYEFAPKGERSIRRMLERAIRMSRRFIYIEDQYLFDLGIARLLAEQLKQLQHLTILVTRLEILGVPQADIRRRRFLQTVRKGGADKVRVFSLKGDTHSYVHAKVWVFDDRFAVIGSANCNSRGMTHDSEVSAGIIDPSRDDRLTFHFAHRLRMRIWAKHLGLMDQQGFAELADGVASAIHWTEPPPGATVTEYEETWGSRPIDQREVGDNFGRDPVFEAAWKPIDPDGT